MCCQVTWGREAQEGKNMNDLRRRKCSISMEVGGDIQIPTTKRGGLLNAIMIYKLRGFAMCSNFNVPIMLSKLFIRGPNSERLNLLRAIAETKRDLFPSSKSFFPRL